MEHSANQITGDKTLTKLNTKVFKFTKKITWPNFIERQVTRTSDWGNPFHDYATDSSKQIHPPPQTPNTSILNEDFELKELETWSFTMSL